MSEGGKQNTNPERLTPAPGSTLIPALRSASSSSLRRAATISSSALGPPRQPRTAETLEGTSRSLTLGLVGRGSSCFFFFFLMMMKKKRKKE